MTLQGWTNPLPSYVQDAVIEDKITIHQGKGFQYLCGEVVNPSTGILIVFQC